MKNQKKTFHFKRSSFDGREGSRPITSIKHGFAFKGEYFTEEENANILLSPGNFNIGGGSKGDKFKYYSGEIPVDYVLKSDDLIVTMTDLSKDGDTLGYPAKIPPVQWAQVSS